MSETTTLAVRRRARYHAVVSWLILGAGLVVACWFDEPSWWGFLAGLIPGYIGALIVVAR